MIRPLRSIAAVLGSLALGLTVLAPCLCPGMVAPERGEHGCCDAATALQAADDCCAHTSTEQATGSTAVAAGISPMAERGPATVVAELFVPAPARAPISHPVSFSPVLRI